MQNCPNCGSPIEPYKCKCEYCGTYYFDFTAFDMSSDTPYFVKFKSGNNIITTLAIPSLETCEVVNETNDLIDFNGNAIKKMVSNRQCDLNVCFHCVASPEDGALFRYYMEEQ